MYKPETQPCPSRAILLDYLALKARLLQLAAGMAKKSKP